MKINAPVLDVLVLCAILALLGVSYIWAEFLYTPIYNDVSPEYLYIETGMSAKDVLLQLKQKNLSNHANLWRVLIYLKQADKKLHAGEFAIEKGITPLKLLERIVKGDVVQYSLTFVEGSKFSDWLNLMQSAPLKHTISEKNLIDFIKSLAVQNGLEGWLYPDTYFFPKGTEDKVLLVNACDKMKEILYKEWDARDKNISLTSAYQALILASIVEKESGYLPERNKVARVFLNRLAIGIPLQADPTVVYALGKEYTGNITKRDLKVLSPYNTYKVAGLPPTPIAMPSRSSIHAVLHPADTPHLLYFVAKGDGSHYFSKTLKEHNQAVQKYLLSPQSEKENTVTIK